MEIRCGPFLFTSKFDGGNMLNVERVLREETPTNGIQQVGGNDVMQAAQTVTSQQDKTATASSQYVIKADFEFNVFTMPDCYNTEFANGNRTWFHFAIRGNCPSKLIRLNIVNMNRQSRLYSQGYVPIWRVLPNRPKWERMREKATFEIDKQDRFVMSFQFRYPEYRNCTVYFAFAYPLSYAELQMQLDSLDRQFSTRFDYDRGNEYKLQKALMAQTEDINGVENSSSTTDGGINRMDFDDAYSAPISYRTSLAEDSIYFCRELLVFTLEKRRVDLLTISDCSNMLNEYEPRFDERLFPGVNVNGGRRKCRMFKNKRVVFISSRVHPGETPSSFVFNGALNLLLRENDPRARELRRRFVFKLVPFLNPDGVYRGHYRTDSRGVNLNRMYLDPNPDLYPTIYAAKSLLVNYHTLYRVQRPSEAAPPAPAPVPASTDGDTSSRRASTRSSVVIVRDCSSISTVNDTSSFSVSLASDCVEVQRPMSEPDDLIDECASETTTITADERDNEGGPGNEGSSDDDDAASECGIFDAANCSTPHLCSPDLLRIPPEQSGVFLYIDLHGHCSKRGCFVYGNAIEDETRMIENLLLAKLISINSAHFDFSACNFSVRNMYARDKRDGLSKEGSGRVALFKHLGLTHSYTLECNYNSGRTINYVSPAVGDDGRATPPISGFPPKYTPEHYEEVGRSMLIAVLDLLEVNSWSRVPTSEFLSLAAVRDWCRSFLKHLRTGSPLKWSPAQFAKASQGIGTTMQNERFLKNRSNLRRQSNNAAGSNGSNAKHSQQAGNGSSTTNSSLPQIGASRVANKKPAASQSQAPRNHQSSLSYGGTSHARQAVHVKSQRFATVSIGNDAASASASASHSFPIVANHDRQKQSSTSLKKSDSSPAILGAAQAYNQALRFKWHRLSDASNARAFVHKNAALALSSPDTTQSQSLPGNSSDSALLSATTMASSSGSGSGSGTSSKTRNGGQRGLVAAGRCLIPSKVSVVSIDSGNLHDESNDEVKALLGSLSVRERAAVMRNGASSTNSVATLSSAKRNAQTTAYAPSIGVTKRSDSATQKPSKTKSMRSRSKTSSPVDNFL